MPGGYADPNAVFPGGSGAPGYPMGTHGQQSWTPPSEGVLNAKLAPKAWLEFDYIIGFTKSQEARFPFVTTTPRSPAAFWATRAPSSCTRRATSA